MSEGPVELRREVERLGPWFHNLHLPHDVQTAPEHWLGDFPATLWRVVAPLLPARLDGWRVLDVGCNAGGHAFELARRGARVLAVDSSERYLLQARWASRVLGLFERVELRRLDVYELRELEGTFDLVVFMGVLYHLRYPLLGLDLVREKVGRRLLFQTLTVPREERVDPPEDLEFERRGELARPGWPSLAFVERRLAGDPTNWWVPDPGCAEGMLRAAGLEVLERRDGGVFLCAPGAAERPAELESAARALHEEARR